MKPSTVLAIALVLTMFSSLEAQQRGGKRKSGQRSQSAINDMVENPLAVGASGVAWYTTWESGLAEAKRSNRPIMFMSAATTCSGVSGVF